MQNEHSLSHILSQFKSFTQWEDKFRFLMQLSQRLKVMPEQYKIEQNLLAGCESQVWIYLKFDPTKQQIIGYFDSDSKLLRGILCIVEKSLEEHTLDSMNNFDLEKTFEHIGILHQLSSNRKTGLKSINKIINTFSSTLKGES